MTPDEIRDSANNMAKPLAALALINPILMALPTITVGVGHLIAWIREMRDVAQQNGEWTEEMNKQFEDSLIARASAPAYQPHKP